MPSKIIILTLINMLTMPQDPSSLEKKIWEMEKSYWNSIKSQDIEKYSSFLHPKFSDWPGFLDQPVLNPEEMVSTVKAIQNDINRFDYVLELMGVSAINKNEVIVYYNCQISMTNQQGEVNEHSHRMIHIWAKHKNEWLLLGGLQTP